MSKSKARDLADFIGSGTLADGTLDVADVGGLQTALDAKAATTYVDSIIDTAPDALNTLNELAAALGDDANFASTVTTSLATKADNTTVTAALATKAPLSNPTFTGTVTATSYVGDGSQLTGVEGVNAAALIKYGAM
jgi:hypothetical protein